MAHAQSARYSPIINLTNGNVQNCANGAVPNGSISFQLNVDATVIAAPYGQVLAAVPIVFQFDSDGNLQSGAQLWSNLELNPQNAIGLGTYYLVTFYDANGAVISQPGVAWQFTQATNSTVDISSMTAYLATGF